MRRNKQQQQQNASYTKNVIRDETDLKSRFKFSQKFSQICYTALKGHLPSGGRADCCFGGR